jgi:hypothetical protein
LDRYGGFQVGQTYAHSFTAVISQPNS